jgi:deoxycytidylate deaminase
MQPQPIAESVTQAPLLPGSEDKDLVKKLKGLVTHELVIALCGPIGVPTRDIALRFEAILRDLYNYQPKILKLSEFIENHPAKAAEKLTGAGRYKSLIDKGNSLRETYGNSVIAELAIAEISVRRDQSRKDGNFVPQRSCHIIDSIKNIDEIRVLKEVYGKLCICIGVYSQVEDRVKRLEQRGVRPEDLTGLINRDSGEELAHGQTVRDVFHLSDFFIRCGPGGTALMDKNVGRICEIIFGTRVVTPTTEETSMYSAYTASLNSACLSRQVGAAVTDSNGNLLGLGWNDVPKFGGGVYGEGDTADDRCHNIGVCANDEEKRLFAEELADILIESSLLLPNKKPSAVKLLKSSRVKALVEFSRAVHAEMLALLNAGRTGGNRMQGGRIFVTTYPCHSCARHIIAAGISEVYYIEPYRKSLAVKLHGDSITEFSVDPNKVKLIPFEGVSPTRYADFFRMGDLERKKDGKAVRLGPKDANFKSELSLKSLPMLEKIVVEKLINQKLLNIPHA